MHRINNVSRLSTNVGGVEHLRVLKEADSSQRGLEAGCRRYIYTLHLSYMRYIRDFTRGRGRSVVYPSHPLSLGQREDIFHSPGACSFSSQGLCGEGEKVPTRWMRFKLGRKYHGMRRQSRGNNDKRPGSAVASHWCRQLCDLSLLPLAVKMAKRRIYVILPPKFYTFT